MTINVKNPQNTITFPGQAPRSPKLYTLQAFRGLAALYVLLFHTSGFVTVKENYIFLFNIFNKGFLGVDFFFVLSGFIIYYAHKRDIGLSRQFPLYLKKRFLRVVPIFWIVLLPNLLAIWLLPQFTMGGVDSSLKGIICTIFLLPQSGVPILGVSWTIKHEIFFYLIFGLSIILPKKISRPIITAWIFLTFLHLFRLEQLLLGQRYDYKLDFLFSFYNIEFCAGCLIAFLFIEKRIAITNFQSNSLIILSFATMTFTGWALTSQEIYFNEILLVGLPFSLLLFGAAAKDFNVQKKPVSKILLFLGDASYSIYLVHVPILSFSYKPIEYLGINQALGPLLTTLLLLFLSSAGVCLLYVFIEKNLLSYLRKKFINEKNRESSAGKPCTSEP